jgi:two-component system phosphate regulon sensor histidine kinase PhoR
MVAELTELSRIETGRAELKLEPVDINALVEDVIRQFMPQMERQNISFQKEFTADLPLINADRERIRQVIGNLIHNAIKFNHSGGDIKARTRAINNSVTVEISDTGIGIARNDLPRIFERFYKADKSRAAQGTGMGLAIAKHVVEAHGGEIWVQSEEGKGSTFGFRLSINQATD